MDTSSDEQVTAILAQLSVRRGRAAIDFYKAAFGAVEEYRVSPESLGGSTTRMLLIVDDPDAAIERAVAAGATEVDPASDEHGWRLGRIEDPFGHHWEIGKPLVAWPPTK
jgi:PhnB protein